MRPIFRYAVAVATLCMSSSFMSLAFCQVVLFDFDNAPLHSSLPITQTVSGVTAHFSATGQGFSIQTADVLGFTPQGFSGQVIYPNSIYLADLLIKFESTLTDFSIMYACQELGCDDAATMRVTAYMHGSFIGTNTKTASNPGTWPVDILSCSFSQGFDSVVVHYDSKPPTCQDYGTIFMADNMQVTPTAALPVSLVYFDCESTGDVAILKWKSADEINLDSYIVQYSRDGRTFYDLTSINAEGSNHYYSVRHGDVRGTTYYRLKMMDQDGSYNYSEIKKLTFKGTASFTIVPNPSNEFIQVYFDNITELKTIQILALDGLVWKTVPNFLSGQKITIRDLPAGMYILKVLSLKEKASFEKMFLKR